MTGRSRLVACAAATAIFVGPLAGASAQGGGCGPCTGRFAVYTHDVLAGNPSAFYPFNDASGSTTTDDSGNGNNATYTGSVSFGQSGVFADSSVHAIGTNPNGYVNDTTDLPALEGSSDRTVELWFNTTSTASMTMFAAGMQSTPYAAFTISLVAPGGPGGPGGSCNPPTDAGVYVQFWSDDIYLPYSSLTDANWHYVAVTVSGAGNLVNVVIDGQQPPGYIWNGTCYPSTPASQTANSPSGFQMPSAVDTSPGQAFTFGGQGWNVGFTGSLDLAAIYPAALAPSVLDAHYLAGTGPAPAVAQVSPSSGPASGGTAVTVTGSGFTDASQVAFGATPASFVLDSSTQITATSPPGTGTADVTVTTPTGTSATGAADTFSYMPAPLVVGVAAPSVTSSTSAAFSATVNPEGLPTTVRFQYGPVLPDTPFAYTGSTTAQTVGPDLSNHVVSASATGLLPNTTYRVQAIATNGAGTATGAAQTFTTPADPAPPRPALGKSFNVRPVSGLVLVKLPHGGFVPLTEVRQLPSGTEVDARLGTIELTAATSTKKHGKLETGTFSGGIFALTQARAGVEKGLTTLSLIEGAFAGAPNYAECKAKPASDQPGAAAQAASHGSKVLQLLHASAHGKFSTRGHYSAATVLGTIWSISDRCDGTLVTVQRDTVSVRDFVRHKTVLLHAHQSYLARAS